MAKHPPLEFKEATSGALVYPYRVIAGFVDNGDGTVSLIDMGGVTDHGALTGLADDDHTQYFNELRGDARYSLLGHNHDLVYLGIGAKAADSDLLDGHDSAYFQVAGNYQPLDADLSAIAALGFTATAFLKKTALNTWALDTATYEPSFTKYDLAGTTNQVNLSASGIGTLLARNITLSLPQDIHTAASPTFAGLTLSSATNPLLKIVDTNGWGSGDTINAIEVYGGLAGTTKFLWFNPNASNYPIGSSGGQKLVIGSASTEGCVDFYNYRSMGGVDTYDWGFNSFGDGGFKERMRIKGNVSNCQVLFGSSTVLANGAAVQCYQVSTYPNNPSDPVALLVAGTQQAPMAFCCNGTIQGYVKGDSAGNLAYGSILDIIFETGGFGASYERGKVLAPASVDPNLSLPAVVTFYEEDTDRTRLILGNLNAVLDGSRSCGVLIFGYDNDPIYGGVTKQAKFELYNDTTKNNAQDFGLYDHINSRYVLYIATNGELRGSVGFQSSDGSSGITQTITTAKLTAGGANGSMTFKNGILTAQTAAN